MSLDVVSSAFGSNAKIYNEFSTSVFSKWREFPISKISHHGDTCCEVAREWLFAMDFTQINDGSILNGPRWIVQRYAWGPTKWPLHWCQALNEKVLDCGAQSAIADEIFKKRGLESFHVQLVQQFSKDATKQWLHKWQDKETSVHWIDNDLIYHECCAIVIRDGSIKIWDGSAGAWVYPRQFDGYGAVRALRLHSSSSDDRSFQWGEHVIPVNNWQIIQKSI